MTKLAESLGNIYSLESLSEGDTIIHKMHPGIKLSTTVIYIISVISISIYDLGGVLSYSFYPIFLMALAELPYKTLISRLLLALPIAIFAGISNVFFNQHIALYIGTLGISYGLISFIVIAIKTIFTVMAVLILVATTPLDVICHQLIKIKVPQIIVVQIMLSYRYISCIVEETRNMYTAYILRSNGKKSINMKDMGNFAGQLLLRSLDRAERVYYSMKCRGFCGDYHFVKSQKILKIDLMYFLIVSGSCLFFKMFSFSEIFEKIMNIR
ncbi:MAG: cobalt ECF transporter T component CbiQ [Proteocatella sp.]